VQDAYSRRIVGWAITEHYAPSSSPTRCRWPCAAADQSRAWFITQTRLPIRVAQVQPTNPRHRDTSPEEYEIETSLPLARRQICWAHLRRDFTAHAEGLAVEKEFGELGLHVCERLFWAWEVFQHTNDRRKLRRQTSVLRRQLKPALQRFSGKSPRNKYCRGMARNLLKLWPALWTFAAVPGVQPTNNHAERSLRGAVIYRKLSLGSQSEQGEQRTARLLFHLDHLPPAAPQPPRLPHRPTQRQRQRQPNPTTQLTPQGPNAYGKM
jgi:Transposase IS66 family